MEVKDYSQKLDQARERFRENTSEMKNSYEKTNNDLKENFEYRTNKQRESYDRDKSNLEEANAKNLEIYSDKTKNEIAVKQNQFKEEIKKNTEKYTKDRNELKEKFDNRLSDISTSFRKSSDQKDRFHSEAQRTLNDRYERANKQLEGNFNQQVGTVNDKSRNSIEEYKKDNLEKRDTINKENQKNLDNLRETSREQNFREVSRLKNDISTLREKFDQEKIGADEARDNSINELVKSKKKESLENAKNFSDLQDNIRKKNLADQEVQKQNHLGDIKRVEKRFSDDLKNYKKTTDHKLQGGTEVDTLRDEMLQSKKSSDNRISNLRANHEAQNEIERSKAERQDSNNNDQIKNLKQSKIDDVDQLKRRMEADFSKKMIETKDKNTDVIDRYKLENYKEKQAAEKRLDDLTLTSNDKVSKQRVEFGKVVNTINEKNIETINALKNEYSKDKTEFIEKSKRDFSDEKNQMKEDFNRSLDLREQAFNKKLDSTISDAQKMAQVYEDRLEQLARKADKEIDSLRMTFEENKIKDEQSHRLQIENVNTEHKNEVMGLREKYERIIAKDRALNEVQSNKIVQKYEDQLDRERFNFSKELQNKNLENQANFERLFKAAELEKETLKRQFEDRIEMMKLADLSDHNSKKA